MTETTEHNYETEARQLGWVPQEDFRGAEEKWVDAQTFVERGQQQLPILRENNRRLQGDLAATKGRLAQLETLFAGAQESLVELKKFHDETFTARVDAEKARIRAEIKEARESGDVEAELDAQERLGGLQKETKQVTQEAKTPPVQQQQQETLTPEFLAWKAANPWFEQDKKKTAVAMALALTVQQSNPGVVGEKFFEKLDEELAETFPSRPNGSKVEGSRGGSGGGQGGGGYADLPADAKAQCDKDAKKFVGEGRAFKSEAEWRKHYSNLYFEREA